MSKLFFLVFIFPGFCFSQTNAQLADSVSKGFRGLSVVNENVIWMSGQKGLVGNSYDGGKKWKWNRVKGFENSDFRSIYSFDKKNAVIANAGFPASILRTSNGGKNWTVVFQSKDSAMFFDGVDFWDTNHGIIFGDPVNGRMYLSETFDGGKTWKEIPFDDRPQLKNCEAGFAASGTTIRVLPGGHVYIGTGGTCARLWHSRDYGHHWEVFETPMLQGKPSQGIFSLAFYDTLHGIIVGGDYLNDSLEGKNIFMTDDGGKNWDKPDFTVKGYFSCVDSYFDYYSQSTILTITGTRHSMISNDQGKTWGELYYVKDANSIRSAEIKWGQAIYFCGGREGFGMEATNNELPRPQHALPVSH